MNCIVCNNNSKIPNHVLNNLIEIIESRAFEIDAVTSATPKGGLVISGEIIDESCVIKVEVNASFDYNSTWTKKNSGVNGQPSVVYQAEISAGKKGEIELRFAGSGSVDGSDGIIHQDAAGLDSAKKIVRIITATL